MALHSYRGEMRDPKNASLRSMPVQAYVGIDQAIDVGIGLLNGLGIAM